MNKAVYLILEVQLCGLEEKTICYVFLSSSLERIDAITLKYYNAEEFFKDKYSVIYSGILTHLDFYKISFPPNEVVLKKIYIQKDQKKIQPLFQTVKSHSNTYSLDDLVKKGMRDGNLKLLLEMDQLKKNQDTEYVSIFHTLPFYQLKKLEFNLLREEEYDDFFEYFQKKFYYHKLIRLFLANDSLQERQGRLAMFLDSLQTQKSSIYGGEGFSKKRYRVPYKDD